ncbi:MAG: VanW family protein [Bacillota bacterium]|nr:VanW family protein [Bacillota bacterium]MDW7684874.1 VanW family protein [Bacillota bacterium]
MVLRKNMLASLLLVFLISLLAVCDYYYYQERIYSGVYVHQLPLGGCTLQVMEETLPKTEVIFHLADGRSTVFSLSALGINPNITHLYTTAHRLGRSRSLPLTYLERLQLWKNKVNFPLYHTIDEEMLLQTVTTLETRFNKEPKDAFFRIKSDGKQITINAEEAGLMIDREELVRRLVSLLAHPEKALSVRIPENLVPARITAASLQEMGIREPIGSFTTLFQGYAEDRVHNIRLAVSHLNNYLIAPGKTFSLNDILGDSTPEKGYRKAPIIVGDQLVSGYGGGLCQVSTTLYNAALLAGLDIIERHHHNLAVPYVIPGRDATISYGARDLKFRNNKSHYILIHANVGQNELTFRLFGSPSGERVVIETEILETRPYPVKHVTDPALTLGHEEITDGEFGYLVAVWKSVYRGNKEVSRERIYLDDYQPYPAVIKQGAAQADS